MKLVDKKNHINVLLGVLNDIFADYKQDKRLKKLEFVHLIFGKIYGCIFVFCIFVFDLQFHA